MIFSIQQYYFRVSNVRYHSKVYGNMVRSSCVARLTQTQAAHTKGYANSMLLASSPLSICYLLRVKVLEILLIRLAEFLRVEW